jgi:hypothetical protein
MPISRIAALDAAARLTITPFPAASITPTTSARGNIGVGLRFEYYGTHSLRRTKASIIYKATGKLRAVQILLVT